MLEKVLVEANDADDLGLSSSVDQYCVLHLYTEIYSYALDCDIRGNDTTCYI